MEIYFTTKMAHKLENDLCEGMGFCSMREKYDLIISKLPYELDDVVNDIFRAEGLNPDAADRRLWRSVRDVIIKANNESYEG